MKIQYPDIGDLQDAELGSIKQAIIIPVKDALRQVRQLVTGNLTIRDNAYAAIMTFGAVPGTSNASLTSGTEYTFANPLPTKPIGFTPIVVTNTSGTSVLLSSWNLNTSRTDGLMGVTVNQDLQHTLPCLIKTASAVQSIPHGGVNTDLSGWDTTTFSRGSVITDDGTNFTVREAGTYQVSVMAYLVAGVDYSSFQLNLKYGTVLTYGDMYIAISFLASPQLDISGTIPMTANSSFNVQAYQTNGASAARTLVQGTNGRRIMINRLYNDSTPTLLVTGILWGG